MPNTSHRKAYEVSYIFKAHGVNTLVVSPGSRNAPLVMAFSQDPDFEVYSIVDERSAAFFALGLIQATRKPVAVCCTSGTALLNYAPAVAEAFYQGLPLIVLSADRPLEKIDQQVGQSIRQGHVLETHTRKSVQLVEDVNDAGLIAYNHRLVNEALIAMQTPQPGPIHINVPFREPLYEKLTGLPAPPKVIHRIEKVEELSEGSWEELSEQWNRSERVLVLPGMYPWHEKLAHSMEKLASNLGIVVLADWNSGLSGEPIHFSMDRILSTIEKGDFESLKPDLLITYGYGQVSKRIKQLLKMFPPQLHWHIQPGVRLVDTYESLSQSISLDPKVFFSSLGNRLPPKPSGYAQLWRKYSQRSQKAHYSYLEGCGWSDLKVFNAIFAHLPEEWDLHLGNSSVIRYCQLYDKPAGLKKVFANRGTSGIDGSVSSAVGYACASDNPTILVVGDISFIYDSNALWNGYIDPKLRIIVLNNGGGGIFRMISGPEKGGILDPFQETPHEVAISSLVAAFGLKMVSVSSQRELQEELPLFFSDQSTLQVMEVRTPRFENSKIWKDYLKHMASFSPHV